MSLPVRERGLKRPGGVLRLGDVRVAPRAGAWIETNRHAEVKLDAWSLPVRERGLKLLISENPIARIGSLPVRERGLKPSRLGRCNRYTQSLPVRERGLKQIMLYDDDEMKCRSPCGSVD